MCEEKKSTPVPLAFVIALTACDSSLGMGAPYDELHTITCKIIPGNAMLTMPPAEYIRLRDRWKAIQSQLLEEAEKEADQMKAMELLGKMGTAMDIGSCK